MTAPIRIKTFRSKTLQDAFEQIRREFGSDASILETKTTKQGVLGRTRIEVTASSHSREYDSESIDSDGEDSDGEDSGGDALSHDNNPIESREVVGDSHREAATTRIANQVPEPADSHSDSIVTPANARVSRVCSQVLQELLEAGIEREIASQWIEAARDVCNPIVFQDAWSLRAELHSWIRGFVHAAKPMDLNCANQQVIAFIGPTGSGKTTTLAKMAANLSIDHGVKVGVLQTDSRNFGVCRALENYAEILGWVFETVTSVDDLSAAMDKLSACRFILIDIGGCSPTNGPALEQMQKWLEAIKPTVTHLVLSSTCSVRSFVRYEQSFGGMNPDSMILTKLDEAGGLGPLFSCLQSSSIPVSYLTDGQQVPSDLIPATSANLAQQVLAT